MARYVSGESVRNLQPTDVFPSPKFRRKPFSFRARSDYTQRMNLLDPLFRSQAVEKAFSNRATLQAMLDFEAALARAEARAGFIPATAAPAIEAKCRAELYDMTALARCAVKVGNPAIPLVKQLTVLVAQKDKEAARYVHWGATSQDAIDTGRALASSAVQRDQKKPVKNKK